MGPIERVGDGVYRVEVDGRAETIYVAGPAHDRWVFWNGLVFRGDFRRARPERRRADRPSSGHLLTAPMPATVVTVHVKPGDAVSRGQVVLLLDAMKMELPIHAPHDAVVADVHCREGQLVDADAPLVDLV